MNLPTFSFYEWLKNFQLMCNNKYGLFIGSIKQQHVNKKLIDSKVCSGRRSIIVSQKGSKNFRGTNKCMIC